MCCEIVMQEKNLRLRTYLTKNGEPPQNSETAKSIQSCSLSTNKKQILNWILKSFFKSFNAEKVIWKTETLIGHCFHFVKLVMHIESTWKRERNYNGVRKSENEQSQAQLSVKILHHYKFYHKKTEFRPCKKLFFSKNYEKNVFFCLFF